MSSLLGTPSERWPLARAVDALAESARQGGIPGFVWIVGIWYPSLNINLDLAASLLGAIEGATEIPIPGARPVRDIFFLFGPRVLAERSSQSYAYGLGLSLLLVPVFCLAYRLIVGLAKASDPHAAVERGRASGSGSGSERAGEPRRIPLGEVWREGRGLGPVAFGMWLIQLAMLFVAMLFLIGPLVMVVRSFELREFSIFVVGLIVPVLFVLLSYAIVLQVLNQLALHSLAHNRRGVASALTHAWRLIRTSPWCAARATVVDLVLFLCVAALDSTLAHFFRVAGLSGPLSWLVLLAVAGFAGVTRAAFWARAYRALGGLSAADQIPGLS